LTVDGGSLSVNLKNNDVLLTLTLPNMYQNANLYQT